MQQELVSTALKKIPFLAQLSDDAIQSLATKAKPAKFPKNATIINEGDETTSLYVILTGKVRVFSSGDHSKEVTLLIQEAGSYFGELALLSDEPRSASVMTLEQTVCGVISKYDFIQWLMVRPEVAISLLGVMSDKIRGLTEKVKQLAMSNVYERVIKVLQEIAVTQEGGAQVISPKPTQAELANMVGSSREMVNKVMKQLEIGGYVIAEDKILRIVKKFPASW